MAVRLSGGLGHVGDMTVLVVSTSEHRALQRPQTLCSCPGAIW